MLDVPSKTRHFLTIRVLYGKKWLNGQIETWRNVDGKQSWIRSAAKLGMKWVYITKINFHYTLKWHWVINGKFTLLYCTSFNAITFAAADCHICRLSKICSSTGNVQKSMQIQLFLLLCITGECYQKCIGYPVVQYHWIIFVLTVSAVVSQNTDETVSVSIDSSVLYTCREDRTSWYMYKIGWFAEFREIQSTYSLLSMQ